MAEEYTGASENGTETQDDSVLAEEKAGKFNWGATITAVLKSKGEISVKKLRKKVSHVTDVVRRGKSVFNIMPNVSPFFCLVILLIMSRYKLHR